MLFLTRGIVFEPIGGGEVTHKTPFFIDYLISRKKNRKVGDTKI